MGLTIAWKECEVMYEYILDQNSRLNLKTIEEVQVNRVVAQVSQTNYFALYFGNLSGFNS
ncbi:uncharacterized protein G2W53_003813 [Senna tora]|uniref:Uncharacterized protein n=1 Tax=Senna tora TaxID=362788 RepID=A0A835CIR8_9FABA|nr:uncharacterized protein G2W53_003813 [Senna tora]